MDYKDQRWRRKREIIMRRDSYWCRCCSRYGRTRQASTVHHIFPVEYFPEKAFIDWNLISLCNQCHNEMHDRDSHKLTDKGWALFERTARNNGQTINPMWKEKLKAKNRGIMR